MKENTEPEKLEGPDSLDREENFPDTEEALPENLELDLSESDPQLEEQEVLPLDEKKKSGTGKIFLFLVLVLAGSGGYLYFNNLIPSEILNLIFPKPAPSTSPALVAKIPPTPLPIEEDVVEPEVVENRNTESVAILESPLKPMKSQCILECKCTVFTGFGGDSWTKL